MKQCSEHATAGEQKTLIRVAFRCRNLVSNGVPGWGKVAPGGSGWLAPFASGVETPVDSVVQILPDLPDPGAVPTNVS
jgi:hypothetical protein